MFDGVQKEFFIMNNWNLKKTYCADNTVSNCFIWMTHGNRQASCDRTILILRLRIMMLHSKSWIKKFFNVQCILKTFHLLNSICFAPGNSLCLLSGSKNLKVSNISLKNSVNQISFMMKYIIYLKVWHKEVMENISIWIMRLCICHKKCWKLLNQLNISVKKFNEMILLTLLLEYVKKYAMISKTWLLC